MIDTDISWGMFTNKGNTAVQSIFDRCLEIAAELTDDEVWQYAYSRLELLSRDDATSEAISDAVRDQLWQQLLDVYAIKDESAVDQWFYENLSYADSRLFDIIVNTYDVQYEYR